MSGLAYISPDLKLAIVLYPFSVLNWIAIACLLSTEYLVTLTEAITA